MQKPKQKKPRQKVVNSDEDEDEDDDVHSLVITPSLGTSVFSLVKTPLTTPV